MTNPAWIFGYGSLINVASRSRTDPLIGPARPVIVQGIQRGWWVRGTQPRLNTTFLGAKPSAEASCGGVIFEVNGGIEEYNGRENEYHLEALEPSAIRCLDGGETDAGVSYGYYAPNACHPPSEAHPLAQSYVDLIMSACLQTEQAYPQAAAAGFMSHFVTSTADWSAHWVDDRRYPRRPMADEPAATAIDRCLEQLVPAQFAAIRIE